MYNYIKKSLFCLLILVMPYMNLSSKAMYEELTKDEIRLTTRLSKVQPCNSTGHRCYWNVSNPSNLICSHHNKHEVTELQTKLESTQKALKPFRDKQEDESYLRRLQIAKAEAELKLLTNPKK